MFQIELPPKPNFQWVIGEECYGIRFEFRVKKTKMERFKWWFSTKLFLPGTYKWLE